MYQMNSAATRNRYSEILEVIVGLQQADSPAQRRVHWLADGGRLGVSRDQHSRLELFLAGPKLQCETETVAANLAFDSWKRVDAEDLEANRVVLPAGAHFDAITAFLCTHLLDNGVMQDVQTGFSRSEKVIEVALDRSRLQRESLVGLVGELLFLRMLLLTRAESTTYVVGSWHGHMRSNRDFQLGPVGIEVKTTRGAASRHHVQGVRQVEPGHGVGGVFEGHFFLLSIGIEALDDENSSAGAWTLPALVDSILGLIKHGCATPVEQSAISDLFLSSVREYGSGDGVGYDHSQMRHQVMFGQRWAFKFARAYDMADSDIRVLRSADLVAFPMLDAASVSFVVSLPTQVRGDMNPVVGLGSFVEKALTLAGL